MSASLATIRDFLAQRRIALVGLSHDPKEFSHTLWRELAARGHELVPVHPTATELEGRPAYPSVSAIPGGVDGALVLTSAAHAEEVVADCVAAGVKRVWLYRAVGDGAVSEAAVRRAEAAGIAVVPGECPLMFLDDAALIHRLHGGWRKLTGTWPEAGAEPAPPDEAAHPGG